MRRAATRAARRRCACLGVVAAALLAVGLRAAVAFTATPKTTNLQRPAVREGKDISARASSGVYSQLSNPVKTVSETINEFYKEYPGPPILPMYRSFIIDFLTQIHLSVVDERFKYDAIFALGVMEYYDGLMGNYDKLLGGESSGKILVAFLKSLGMDVEKVKSDAEAMKSYASSTSPAQILQQMEGTEVAPEKKAAEAFSSIGPSLYSMSFSVGLFKMMELAGVETTKANVEEWAKALKITPPSKSTSDLETYKQNKKKLQQSEEMLREVEIREKKKLAQRLEEKAKALASKAAGKAAETKEDA